jgi:hypothetical protein
VPDAPSAGAVGGAYGLPHVANTRALQSLRPGQFASVVRDGFAAAGDAPPLTFNWRRSWPGSPDNRGFAIAPEGRRSCASGCWIASGQANDFNILEFAGNAAPDYGVPCSVIFGLFPAAIGGRIAFPPGITYPFETACHLGATLADGAVVTVDMVGAKLTTNKAGLHIFDRSPTDQKQAISIVGAQFYFDGGLLVGSGARGQEGIHLGASYGAMVRQTYLQNFDQAIECQFCLKAYLLGVRTSGDLTYGIDLSSGTWRGASTSNAQSNGSTIVSARDYARAGASASWAVLGTDGVRIEDSISEGGAPVQEVYFDDRRSSTVKSLIVSNLHSENAPLDALITLAGGGGETFDLGGVYAQYAAPLVDSTGLLTSPAAFHVHDVPWSPWGTGVIFKGNGPPGSIWTIDNFFMAVDLTATEHWSSGTAGPLVAVGRFPNGAAALEFGALSLGSPSLTTSIMDVYSRIQFPTDDTYNIGSSATAYRPHSLFVGTGGVSSYGGYRAGGAVGVSCPAGTVNPSTMVVTNGIVTHC